MPLRPLCRACIHYRNIRLPLHQSRHFHPTRRKLQRDADLPNYYETLDLPHNASAGEVKKQFYTLSKKYHPDLNPNDSSASAKFVKISEAYHVLGSAEKRGVYDREFQRANRPGMGGVGSWSSSAGPVGARPASGLSKRRTAFRGPPPSFYAQGGYGSHSTRRAQTANETASNARSNTTNPGGLGSDPSFSGTGGYGPGAGEYVDPDLPYFDKESHRRTHDNLGSRWEKKQNEFIYPSEYAMGGSMWFNFFLVTGVVGMAVAVATYVVHGVRDAGRPKRKEKEKR